MNRRVLLGAMGGLLAWPPFALAQQTGRNHRVCWLSSLAPKTESYNAALVQRLRDLGFVEGRNLVIEYRSAEGRTERLLPLATDLARQGCDAILGPGTEANLLAVREATRNAPIVVVATDYDPVATGHVASLARPGSEFGHAKPDALLTLASGLFVSARKTIPALALRHRLPSMFNNRLWADNGGLLSYGVAIPPSMLARADEVIR